MSRLASIEGQYHSLVAETTGRECTLEHAVARALSLIEEAKAHTGRGVKMGAMESYDNAVKVGHRERHRNGHLTDRSVDSFIYDVLPVRGSFIYSSRVASLLFPEMFTRTSYCAYGSCTDAGGARDSYARTCGRPTLATRERVVGTGSVQPVGHKFHAGERV